MANRTMPAGAPAAELLPAAPARELAHDELRFPTALAYPDFTTTDDIRTDGDWAGQDRALAARLTVAHRRQRNIEARQESIAQHQAGDRIAGLVGLALRVLCLAARHVAD